MRTALDPQPTDRLVSLRRALGVTSFGINQITLQPRQRLRIHRHERQEEVYLVVDGRLSLTVEGTDELVVSQGELVRIPASVRRQLANRFNAPCTLVAIGAADMHEGRDAVAFADWDDTVGGSPQEIPRPEDLPAS
jgi:mannose-6-phosphate isomerase-like protein (cupin superfamily)